MGSWIKTEAERTKGQGYAQMKPPLFICKHKAKSSMNQVKISYGEARGQGLRIE